MKAKSLLLTVPLAVSALLSLSLPANAVCWSWKPCADYQGGFGYGAPPTESQILVAAFGTGERSASRVSDRTARRDGSAGSGRGAGKSETEEAGSHGYGYASGSAGEAETEAGSSPSAGQGRSASGTSSGASTG